MPKLTFQWNSVPKLTLRAEVHRFVPKLFRAEVTQAEHRLPLCKLKYLFLVIQWTLDQFQFRWLNIKGFDTAFPISITLFSYHLKWNSSWGFKPSLIGITRQWCDRIERLLGNPIYTVLTTESDFYIIWFYNLYTIKPHNHFYGHKYSSI